MSYIKLSELAKTLGESISYGAFFRHFSPWHKAIEQKPVYVPPNKINRFRIDVDEGKDSMRDFNDLSE